MSKFKVTIYFTGDEEEIELDDLYDTEEEAEEAGNTWLSDMDTGAMILKMSNPGDFDEEDVGGDAYFEIDEVDE